MSKPTILLIDDDFAVMRYYIATLRESGGYEVDHARDPDDGLTRLSSPGSNYAMVIIDSMMPPGRAFEKEDTDEGINTGKLLFNHIRQEFPFLPILVLTNLSHLEWFPSTSSQKPTWRQMRKIDVDPFDLVDAVQTMISDSVG